MSYYWDQEMNELLDDVRRDAMSKLHEAKEKDGKPLFEAIQRVIEMGSIAWGEGVLALEGIILEGGMECTENFLFLLSYFKNGLDYIYEIASNEYWTRNLQGIQAMVFYIYFKGMVAIFEGCNPRVIEEIMISLLPEEYLQDEEVYVDEYSNFHVVDKEEPLIRYTAQGQEKIDLQRKEQQEKEMLEKKQKEEEEKQLMQKFFSSSHNFQNTKLLEKLRELEQEILENLSDQSVETIVEFEEGRKNMINRCLYGLGNKARMKIMKRCRDWVDFFFELDDKDILVRSMKCVMELGEQEEEEILGAVLMMLGTIKRLRKTGKIQE